VQEHNQRSLTGGDIVESNSIHFGIFVMHARLLLRLL
jgi:hypothetical protein